MSKYEIVDSYVDCQGKQWALTQCGKLIRKETNEDKYKILKRKFTSLEFTFLKNDLARTDEFLKLLKDS